MHLDVRALTVHPRLGGANKTPAEMRSTFGNSLSLRVDGDVGAMSLSPNGRDAVLAGRKGLFIIDLDDPFTTPRWLHHITSWEVADVQWLPHHHVKPLWCVSTLNQKALLWDLARPSHNAILNVLHRHTRAITDINFHPLDPELLATCSIDTFVLTWDMRAPRRPINKCAQWRAGATQVKWNAGNPYELALSHHHSFLVWDSRKGAIPVWTVDSAHDGKINGLDFGGPAGRLITCSNDSTIKLWDLPAGGQPRTTVVIHTDYPVARARELPFGSDDCCGIMPVRKGDNAVHIVNYTAELERARSWGETVHMDAIPDFLFRGHHGPLKDFLWRPRHPRYAGFKSDHPWTEYQLVTWAPTDCDLRLWAHDKKLYDIASYHPLHHRILDLLVDDVLPALTPGVSVANSPDSELGEDAAWKKPYNYASYVTEPSLLWHAAAKDLGGDVLTKLAAFTIRKAQSQGNRSDLNHLTWISGVRLEPDQKRGLHDEPANLGEEISVLSHKFPKVWFEKISVTTGHIVISLNGPLPSLPDAQAEQKDLSDKTLEKKTSIDKSIGNTSKTEEEKLVFIRLEARFPPTYPFLSSGSEITFKIEETHELGPAVKAELLKNLNEAAQFYTNQNHRFCLEPCLRYLLGEQLTLDQSLLDNSEESEEDSIVQTGNETWADDLINDHEAAENFRRDRGVSGDEDDDADLITFNDKYVSSAEALRHSSTSEALDDPALIKHDLTPLPKGCGAIWTRTGELVCFFIPKNEHDERDKMGLLFDQNGLGLKTERRVASDSESEDSDNMSIVSSLSLISSNDSFSNDWDEMLQDDIPLRSRMGGVFRRSVEMGHSSVLDDPRISERTLTHKLSAYGDRSFRKSRKGRSSKSVVSIIDLKHLIPDKYELACDYRVLGDSPEVIARHNSSVAFHHGQDEIGRVWQIVAMILNKDIYTTDLSEVGKDLPFAHQGTVGRFHWGNHPFGHLWLIVQLFDYFKKTQNLQMLAMLSCILFENLANMRARDTHALDVPIHTPYSTLPPRPSVFSIREHGLNSDDGSDSIFHESFDSHMSRKASTITDMIPKASYESYSRSISPSRVDSPRKGPLMLQSSPSMDLSQIDVFLDRRSRSFEASKRFGRLKKPVTAMTRRPQTKGKFKQPPSFTIQMHNVELLDLYEDAFGSPLLSGIDAKEIAEFREQYANMLYSWGLPMHRIKILKFNYPDLKIDSTKFESHLCSYGTRSRKAMNPKQQVLNTITPINTARFNAWNTSKRSVLQYCGYCGLVIPKKVVLCTKCEHIMHSDCAEDWWAGEDSKTECPTGCGCFCMT